MNRYYDPEGNPYTGTEVEQMTKWADDSSKSRRTGKSRRISLTQVGHITVSTVWLGLNHAIDSEDEPQIFETLFSSIDYEYIERYATKEAALKGHKMIVDILEVGLGVDGEDLM